MNRYSINKVKGTDINISLPTSMFHTTIGIGESIDNLVKKETEKRITPFEDQEQIAYKSTVLDGITINLRFLNKITNTFENSYLPAGFAIPDDLNKNSFTKSFFRLYFYDSNVLENRNLVLFEEFETVGNSQPRFNLDKIFWFRNDKDFIETNDNKTFYIIGRFFNALTGKVHDFMNLPLDYDTQINITQFRENSSWWSSPILVINPKNNNGSHNFSIIPFIGANTINEITLTEQIIL
jgi:hypothetical protein